MNADLAARSVRSRHRDRGRSQRQRQADHSGDAVLRQHHFFTEQRSPARQVRPCDVRMSPSSRSGGQSSQGQPAGSLPNHPAHRTDSRPAWLLEQATGMDSLPRNQGSRSTGITFNRDHAEPGSRGTGVGGPGWRVQPLTMLPQDTRGAVMFAPDGQWAPASDQTENAVSTR